MARSQPTPDEPFQVARLESQDASASFVHAIPSDDGVDELTQFRSMASNALRGLHAVGGVPADIVAGWVYLRDRSDSSLRHELATIWGEHDPERIPLTFLLQAPAAARRYCEVHLQVAQPRSRKCSVVWRGSTAPGGMLATTVLTGGSRHLRLLSVTPRVEVVGASSVRDLVVDMFSQASHALTARGLSFHDVARTWIYLRDIGRDYEALNQGRTSFYERLGLSRLPASTGIQAGLAESTSPVGMDLYAIGQGGQATVEAIKPHPMGEAASYGASFARGTLVNEPGCRLVYLSGTASIDHNGAVVAVKSAKGQVQRMLSNASGLLAKAGFSFSHALSATVYLKRAAILPQFLSAVREAGLPSWVPIAIVVADICRPEWACEIEMVAGQVSS